MSSKQRIYRAWCPEIEHERDDAIVAIADSASRAAETWAAWADAYLSDASVARGVVRRVLVAEGADDPVELIVSGYTGAVYGAMPPAEHERITAEQPRPRRGELRSRQRGTVPALPRPPRLLGTAYTADNEPAIYTEGAMRSMLAAVYAAGVRDATPDADPDEMIASGAALEAEQYERRTRLKAHD